MASDLNPTSRPRGVLAKFALAFATLLACSAALGLYAVMRLDISYLGQRFRVLEAATVLANPQGKTAEEKTLAEIRSDEKAALAQQSSAATPASPTKSPRSTTSCASSAWRARKG